MSDHGSNSDGDVRIVDGAFVAPFVLEYPYARTLGPVLARFFSGLAERRIEGTRSSDGTVHVPPAEFDPATGEALDEWVTVADTGTVTTWTWQREAGDDALLDPPFAWALVRLDGASTAVLHAVDVASPDELYTGARVRVRWSEEPSGGIRDIACFELVRESTTDP